MSTSKLPQSTDKLVQININPSAHTHVSLDLAPPTKAQRSKLGTVAAELRAIPVLTAEHDIRD